MSRTVTCRKYKVELEGLARPPLPGAIGQDIFDNVSQKAWAEWTELQTQLINEKQLSTIDPDARKYLAEQREKFLNNEQHDEAEGFVAPES